MTSKKKLKLKWRVCEKATGLAAIGYHRGWPSGGIGEDSIISLHCEDSYFPPDVREGNHGPIKILITDRRALGPGFKWVSLKKRASTLEEAKELAQDFVNSNPRFIGRG